MLGARRLAAQAFCFSLRMARGLAMFALSKPDKNAAQHHTQQQSRKDQHEQRQFQRSRVIYAGEGVKMHPHQMAIGDAKSQNKQCNGENNEISHKCTHDQPLVSCSPPVIYSPVSTPSFRRMRISLPALKKGTAFSSTATCVPVRGLRP
jgi:hypothetical protein